MVPRSKARNNIADRYAELCERLSRVAPGNLNTTFLSPVGGSDAIESALKLARQYHLTQGRPDKHLIVSHLDSYHGMSMGALSVGGIPGMRRRRWARRVANRLTSRDWSRRWGVKLR